MATGTRLVAGIVVIVAALGIAPASAQTAGPWWTESTPEILESGGAVTLVIEFWRPGRVGYRTVDKTAEAPHDYTAVSGEVVFEGSSAGDSYYASITIPIVDDDLRERHAEELRVETWAEPQTGTTGISTAQVFIIDDDDPDGGRSSDTTVTSTTAMGSRGSRETEAATVVPLGGASAFTSTTASQQLPEATVRSEEVPPALRAEEAREHAAGAPGRRRGSTAAWASVVVAAGVAGIALAMILRRWRGSAA